MGDDFLRHYPLRERARGAVRDGQPPGRDAAIAAGKTEGTRVTPLVTAVAVLRGEWPVLAGLATTVILWRFGRLLPAPEDGGAVSGIVFAWIFGVMLWGTFAVVRHADGLADRLGEPYGTLILTMSATAIEVAMISTVMLHGANDPTLARDMMFAVLMIVLNGMAGLTLLVGALRHREQYFNFQGAAAFLNLLVPLSVPGLVLPAYTTSTPGPTLAPGRQLFLVAASVTLYGIFLTIQTVRHRGYFQHEDGDRAAHHGAGRAAGEHAPHRPSAWHALGIVVALVPVILLAEWLAAYVDHATEHLGAPAVGGVRLIGSTRVPGSCSRAERTAPALHPDPLLLEVLPGFEWVTPRYSYRVSAVPGPGRRVAHAGLRRRPGLC
jgi:Ca2+:H+ antiporter